MSDGPEIVRTSLRLNRRLYDRIAEAAERRGLTMHAEIIYRLEESFHWDSAIEDQIDADTTDELLFDMQQQGSAFKKIVKLALEITKTAKVASNEIENIVDIPEEGAETKAP